MIMILLGHITIGADCIFAKMQVPISSLPFALFLFLSKPLCCHEAIFANPFRRLGSAENSPVKYVWLRFHLIF